MGCGPQVRTGHVWQLKSLEDISLVVVQKIVKNHLGKLYIFRNCFFPDLCIDMDMGQRNDEPHQIILFFDLTTLKFNHVLTMIFYFLFFKLYIIYLYIEI